MLMSWLTFMPCLAVNYADLPNFDRNSFENLLL